MPRALATLLLLLLASMGWLSAENLQVTVYITSAPTTSLPTWPNLTVTPGPVPAGSALNGGGTSRSTGGGQSVMLEFDPACVGTYHFAVDTDSTVTWTSAATLQPSNVTITYTPNSGTGTGGFDVIITGNEFPAVSFGTQWDMVSEGKGPVTVTLKLSKASSQTVTVQVSASGSATSGADYTMPSGPFIISAGSTSTTFSISIVADGIKEPDETIVLTIGSPTNATVGSPPTETVTIYDAAPYAPGGGCGCYPCPCATGAPAAGGDTPAAGTGPSPSVFPAANTQGGTGGVQFASDAMSSRGMDSWGEGRTYSTISTPSQNRVGVHWASAQRPEISIDTSGAATVTGPRGMKFYFAANGTSYRPKYYSKESLVHTGTDYIFTDTNGARTTFYDYTATPSALKGQFKKYADRAGNATSTTYDVSGNLTSTRSSVTTGGVTTTIAYAYAYNGDGTVSTVTQQQQVGSAAAATIRTVFYDYYTGAVGEFGDAGELKRVTVADGQSPPAIIDQTCYRYYHAGESAGFAGALKYVVNPATYALMVGAGLDPTTVSEATLAIYADAYYEYDASQRVSKAIVSGSGCSCSGSGQGTTTFSYTTAANAGPNNWATKMVEQRFDMNLAVVYTRTLYTNDLAQVLLDVMAADGVTTRKHYVYDAVYRQIEADEPSAVASFDDTYPDLHVSLNASSGLIHLSSYASATTATTTTPGNVAGYLQSERVKQGSAGTPITVHSQLYIAHTDGGGVTIYPLASETVYRNTNGTGAETTSYAYSWKGTTNQMASKATSRPVVTAAQNGPGTADTSTEVYDIFGRVQWTKDADGFITFMAYDDATGAVIKRIDDVQVAQTADFVVNGVTYAVPTGWTTPAGGGSRRIHQYVVDALGRTTKDTDPAAQITYTIYDDVAHETRVYPGWSTSTHKPTGTTHVSRNDRARNYLEELDIAATPTLNASSEPTGQEAISGLATMTRTYLDGGGRQSYRDDYYSFSGLTYATTANVGTLDTHYHRTWFAYDPLGKQNREVTGGAATHVASDGTQTVMRTVYDGRGRPISRWLGTIDQPATGEWSPTNNGAPCNLVKTVDYVYDVEDDLTRQTEYPTASPSTNRVTANYYDWRDRLVATKQGVEATESTALNRPITYCDLDNLGECTAISRFDGDAVTITTSAGVPQKPSASLLRAYSQSSYDNQGRVYQRRVYSVDQATGAVSTTALTSDTWYSHRGLVVKTRVPGGLVSKTAYNGTGWVTQVSMTDGGGDTTWANAFNETGDLVLSQTLTSYDAVGRPALITRKERFHDETATGDLVGPATVPKARVSYEACYDSAVHDRVTTVEVGTNGGAAYTRPGSAPAASDTVLVTTNGYTGPRWLNTVTDPRGIKERLNRTTMGMISSTNEAWDGTGAAAPSGDANRTIKESRDKAFNVASIQAALPSGQNSQTTTYVYGTSGTSDARSNNLLVRVKYPDPTTGASTTTGQETYAYNALGQVKSKTDSNGSVHTYSYDVVGRLNADAVTTLGAGVSGTVRRIEIAYDTAGRPFLFTSYSAASAGTVVNQVWRVFNGLGQLVQEYQSLAGAATSGSPYMQYDYTEMAGGANHSRLTAVTYPNGRVLRYEYNAGLDNSISRVSFLADDNAGAIGTHLEEYSYLGLSRIVRRNHPEPGLEWTLIKQGAEPIGDAGDQYTGLDRFGRLVDVRWLISATGSHTDRFQYGYDRVGQKLYENNRVRPVFSELFHANGALNQSAYDKLGRMTAFTRGTLSASGANGTTLDTVTTASDPNAADPIFGSQSWSLDQVNNWKTVTSDGTMVTRTHDSQNKLTSDGTTTYGYDLAGNLTTQTGKTTNVYDAWNRAVGIRGTTYAYDAFGRRVKETTGATSRSFYHKGWQVVETRLNATTTAYEQFVYSLAYVDAVVLRDRDTVAGGDYGFTGSGLDQRLYVQHDREFSVTSLISAAGAVVERMAYDPYGDVSYFDASWTARTGSSYANNVGFTGRWHDSTGMIYFRKRMYDPVLGRFVSRDPLRYRGGGMSLYAGYFVPNGVDPFGLKTITLNIGYDGSADPSNKKPMNDAVAQLKANLSVCCKTYNVGCGIDVKVNDVGQIPAIPEHGGYPLKERPGLYNLVNYSAPYVDQGGIPIILTGDPMIESNGGTAAGQTQMGLGEILNQNSLAADPSTLSHETGHYAGYDQGNFVDPLTGKVDTKHSADPHNIMYPTNKQPPPNLPDRCWCEKVAGKAK